MPVTDTHRDPYTIVAEAEESRKNWLYRTFGREVTISDMFYYASAARATPDIHGNIVLKRNILIRFLPVIVLVFMAAAVYNVWFNFPRDRIFPGLMIFAVVWLIASVISMVVYISKHKGVDITINKEGIQMGERYFFWKEIRATFLVDRSQGRNKRYFLVFVMQDNTLTYFDLTAFPTWSKNFKTLCTAIRDFHRPV